MTTNTIPKSLHTVSVLVAVAGNIASTDPQCQSLSQAVDKALMLLGYAAMPDTYGLAQQALKKLSRAAALNKASQ